MEKVITGAEACNKYGLTVMQLAQACDRGELIAYSPFDGEQIFSASMCHTKRRYPQKFAIQSPSFIPEKIFFHSDTCRNFDIYINDKQYEFNNECCCQINGIDYFIIDICSIKLLHVNIIIEPKNLTFSNNMLVSIIFKREYPLFNNDINCQFFHVNEYIHLDTDGIFIKFKISNNSFILPLSLTCVIRNELYKNGVEKSKKLSHDTLEFLWNNTFDYYKEKNSEEFMLAGKNVFVFNFDIYKKYNSYYINNNKIEENFSSLLLGFKYIESSIYRVAILVNVLNTSIVSALDYINNVYTVIMNATDKEKDKIYIDAYLLKIHGKSLKKIKEMISDKYNLIRSEDHISRMIRDNIKKISEYNKIPYIPWKDFTGNEHKKEKKSNEEIVRDIKSQLAVLNKK